MKTEWCGVAAVFAALAGVCGGAEQHIVLPSGFENSEGAINNALPIASSSGTQQTLYSVQEMSTVPAGSRITGLQVRQDGNFGFVPWPHQSFVVQDYRVFMGTSALTPGGFSNTFSVNITDKKLVRSGSLAIAAGAYPGSFPIGGPPRGWGPVIVLDVPYLYKGGPLVIEWRNSGAGSNGGTSGDAAANSALAAGGGNSTSPEATTSNGSSVAIVRLTYLPPGCPGDLNGDGMVDDSDFVLFVVGYNILDCADPTMPAGCPADLDKDGLVDDGDFVVFVAAYNELVCP